MTLEQFVRFLDDHRIKLPGSERTESMFNKIDMIFDEYLNLKLEKSPFRQCVKAFSCLRRWSDEKSRWRKSLDSDYKSKKGSTLKIVLNLYKLYSQVTSQASFLS